MRRQDYFRQELQGWLRLHEKGGKRHDVPAHHRGRGGGRGVSGRRRRRRPEDAAVSERRPGGRAERAAARAPGGAGDDQAAGRGGGAAGVDVLPHVSGDGDHGVPVERGDARARAADCRARVAEDDEAELRERMAKLEGSLEGFLAGRRWPNGGRLGPRDGRAARGEPYLSRKISDSDRRTTHTCWFDPERATSTTTRS